jgi:hypothetical protein
MTSIVHASIRAFVADAGLAGIGGATVRPSLSVCDYDRCADLHVLEQPLGIRDVHSDAAV